MQRFFFHDFFYFLKSPNQCSCESFFFLLSVRTLQCLSNGFSFYIRLILDGSDCSISPAHIYFQSHTVSACFLFCHHFTPKPLACILVSRHRASCLSLQPVRLVEVFGKFFYCCPFHSDHWKHPGIFFRSLRCTDM